MLFTKKTLIILFIFAILTLAFQHYKASSDQHKPTNYVEKTMFRDGIDNTIPKFKEFTMDGVDEQSHSENCKFVKDLEPNYLVCHHPVKSDYWVSRKVSNNMAWQRELAYSFKTMMDKFGHKNPGSTYFLDVGANIGTNSLYIAASGYPVWSIEPLTINLQLTVVIKFDIETYECKAILGSKDIFEMNSIYIPVMFVEWHYLEKTGKLNKNCELDKMKELADLFTSHGYNPYQIMKGTTIFRRLDTNIIHRWKQIDTAWIHNSAGFNDFKFVL